jgi:hypothetical protein
MKKWWSRSLVLPEYYVLILCLLAAYTPPFSFNPIFIALGALIVLQIIFKKRGTGLILGLSFLGMNFLFLLALLSELAEMSSIPMNSSAMAWGGFSLLFLNFAVAAILIYKYQKHHYQQGIEN